MRLSPLLTRLACCAAVATVGLGAAEIVGPKTTITLADGTKLISWTITTVCANTTETKYCYQTGTPKETTTSSCSTCPDSHTSSSYTNYEWSDVYCSPGSKIDNLSFNYHHQADDYLSDPLPSAGSCASCGGAAGATVASLARVSALPSLQVTRFHRYRDMLLAGSFGPGVFQTYDEQLTLSVDANGARMIEYFAPQVMNVMRFVDGPWSNPWGFTDALDGVYHNYNAFGVDLRLYNAAGVLTTDQATATSAVLTYKNGDVRTFQIVDIGGVRVGRLVSMQDRTGAGLAVAYRYQPTDDLGGSPSRLRQIATVSDEHGRQLQFTYANAQVSGQWVVSRIDLPNGGANIYSYQDGHLAAVDFPSGDRATFTQSYDAASQKVVVAIDDPGAQGTHRRKSAYLSTVYTVLPDAGSVYPQSAQLIRMLVNGDGEVSYLNVPHPQYTATLLYEGAGRLTYDAYYLPGMLEHRRQFATNWSLNPATPQSYSSLVATYESAYATDSYATANNTAAWYTSTPTSLTNTHGLTVGIQYDLLGRPVKRSYPDGTCELTSYNAASDPTLQVDRLGRATATTYDAIGNRLSETTGLHWNVTTQATEPTSATATRSWVYGAVGTPARQRLLAAIDANGNRTDYGYDARGFLVTRTDPADAAGGPRAVTTLTYDAAGRVVQVSEPGVSGPRVTTFAYDGRNRLVTATYGDGSTDVVTYGSGATANLVTARTDRNGNRTELTYDGSGRLINECTFAAGGTQPLRTVAQTWLVGTEQVASRTEDGERTAFGQDYRHRPTGSSRTLPGSVILTETRSYDTKHQPYLLTDAYGRRTFRRFDADSRVIREVRELIPGGLAGVPTDIASVSAFLAGLSRPVGANPPYIIEDRSYDAAGQLLATVDAGGTRMALAYDGQGRVTSQTEADGTADAATTRFQYDSVGNRIQLTTPRGIVSTSTYTGRNQVATQTEASGTAVAESTTWTYTITGKPATQTDARGATTSHMYGGCCDRLLGITDAAGYVTAFSYDPVGNRLTVTDGNGLATTTTYDGLNRVATMANARGEVSRISYDTDLTDGVGIDAVPAVQAILPVLGFTPGVASGSAVAVTDPQGAVSYDLRDGLGRSVARIDALGHATRLVYDTVVDGLVETAIIDPLGHVTRARSDASGRPRVQVDALGNASTTSFAPDGDQIAQTDALGIGWTAVYDARHRLLSRTSTRQDVAASTAWTYDLDGNRLTETDATGQTETNVYNERNRRIALVDRVHGTTRFSFDAVGNLLSISDADNEGAVGGPQVAKTTQYAYDARNLLIAEVFPTGQQGRTLRVYAYDGGRRLINRQIGLLNGAFSSTPTFAGAVATTGYTYDAANRLLARNYGDGLNDGFGYDATGRLTNATSARYATTVGRGYDAAGRLTSESLQVPDGVLVGTTLQPTTWTVTNAYLDDNSLASQTYPTGSVVTRSYTPRRQLEEVSLGGQRVTRRTYDTAGRLTSSIVGPTPGLYTETRTYIPGDRLVAAIAAPNVTNFTYTYDAMGRKLTESALNAPTQTFAYNEAGRPTSWSAGTDTQSWDLSKVGDWISTTRGGVVESRQHTAVHEATQVGTNLLTYDVQGNLTKDERQTALAWDPENRLLRACVTRDASVTGFGSVATYRYDALGRRIGKTVDGVTTLYIPAGPQTVVEMNRPAQPAAQADINGATADGTLANMSLTPASGGVLGGTPTRINFQPATAATPAGFLRDTGKPVAMRTNGLSYGWSTDASAQAVIRNGAVPLPEFDTFIQAQPNAGGSATWSIALPDGTYPVVVVAGDALSTEQTNHLIIGGVPVTDTSPSTTPAYEAGNFDGYAVQATVTGGTLTIAPGPGAFHAKLCFVEIGAQGSTLDQATLDRLAALVTKANAETGANPQPTQVLKEYAYLDYVDAVGAYTVSTNGGPAQRYYPAYNHLWSAAALTDANGATVERYTYSAFGKQTITRPVGGTPATLSIVGFNRAFTGLATDRETGLLDARHRIWSTTIGHFLSRDTFRTARDKLDLRYHPRAIDGYRDGWSLYTGYYVPNEVDWTGEGKCPASVSKKCGPFPMSVPLTSERIWTNAQGCKCITCDYGPVKYSWRQVLEANPPVGDLSRDGFNITPVTGGNFNLDDNACTLSQSETKCGSEFAVFCGLACGILIVMWTTTNRRKSTTTLVSLCAFCAIACGGCSDRPEQTSTNNTFKVSIKSSSPTSGILTFESETRENVISDDRKSTSDATFSIPATAFQYDTPFRKAIEHGGKTVLVVAGFIPKDLHAAELNVTIETFGNP